MFSMFREHCEFCKHVQDINNTNARSEDELPSSSDFVNPCKKEELISQLVFDSVEDAEKFYIAYAKAEGFDVRRRSVQKKGPTIKNRVWVCTREGFREKKEEARNMLRESKPLTRSGCKATFRVTRDWNSGKYMVSRFLNNHNHELHVYPKSYLSPPDKALLSLMTKTGIKPSLVMHYLDQIAGGAGKLSFKKKTAYNWLNKLRAERIREGDIHTVINKLKESKQKDDRFFYKYCVDEEDTLTRLFWCDGSSRAEYEAFGDVLVFDSSYKTNRYLYPLVIFSGVNNHGSTCIFAACFLQDETIESYQWVLQTFLEAMGGKIPESVLTDQDAAMRSAIVSEFVGSRHRICSWHLCRNVRKNIKKSSFCNEFCSLVDRKCSIEEFELSWSNTVENHNLSNNKWVLDTYEIRERWAEAYFREQFMCMMTTTQRAESVNALIKLSVEHKMTITDFLDHYERTLQRLRSDFIEMQKKSEMDDHDVRESPLKCLEEHAISIYTLKIFYMIRKEIRDEQGVVGENRIGEAGGNQTFFYRENKETGVSINKVIVGEGISKFQCDCFKLESEGIPCRHIISTLKYYGMKKFPESMLKRRWLKYPGTLLRKKFPDPIPIANSEQQRFGKLNAECLVLSVVSSQTEPGYSNSLRRVRDVVDTAKDELMMHSRCGSVPSENNVNDDNDSCDNVIQDPPITKMKKVCDPVRNKTRGATKFKKQKCGICGVPGHKSTTCQLKKQPTWEGEKKYKGHNAKTSSVSKQQINPEIPFHQVNNPQFPVNFNMPDSIVEGVLNMQPNNSVLPLFSHTDHPMVPGAFTTLLWQQQAGAASGSVAHSFPDFPIPPPS
ncbi:hypothetical protein ACJIZ3_011568 [Penstemon smallii]|uniref:SWIM-type domain-containing protein n=1 Tax=Penstemon smallii TaxID=265156 RepID=A0ABD3UL51_9LAMI